jgi:hypothetical protein
MVHEPSFELVKVTVSAACGVVEPQEVQLPEALQLAVELAFQVQLLASAARVDAMLARTPTAKVTQRRQHEHSRVARDREGRATVMHCEPMALPGSSSTASAHP